MSKKKIILCLFFSFFSFATVLLSQDQDSCHIVVLHLVDKKGKETGFVDTVGCVKPCKGSFTAIIDKKPFLGKRKTYYDPCSGQWLRIEYYFLGILTRTRRNPAFDDIK